ncbi:uncharacterized protein LOC132030971 [Lycium ferocissimum]|uniref:uncharacterized protein LOC132030971 n=1 Tax=Lycium ferocissimum TaxID=112874 RepID=UPI0028157803|nr:uncharacterized protein LOC132030971 [Lycium ferocissimum]
MKCLEIDTEITNKFLFIWCQDECTKIGDTFGKDKFGFTVKPAFFKELKKVWSIHTKYDVSNTLLVDDSPYKAFLNPAHTAIFPHSYQGNWSDTCLGKKLHYCLNTSAVCIRIYYIS